MAWREGEQVGPYQIVSQLGQGGMATVYRAYHAQLDRTVAIKVMHQMFLDDETFVARFKREAQIVARLEHPHIIPVYDFNEHEKQPYLVMKYVPGMTLKQRLIKKGPLPLNEILSVMNAIGGALAYAHNKGVLHRDVKPSNIVLDEENVPYLTDFGLARIAAAGESTMSSDMVLGTPHYISPEQASGRKDLDGRADIYSLGVVMYELLVGRVPFTADTAYAIIHDHIYTPIPLPSRINPEIPPAVEEVLLKATEKRPEDRYDTTELMLRDLRDAVEESRLNELSADRGSVASESLAKYRSELGTGVTPPPSTIAMPIPSGTESYRTATVYQSKPMPRSGRAWMLGGCGAFLLISFIIAGLMLSSLNYFLELQQISQRLMNNNNGQASIISGLPFIIGAHSGFFSENMDSSDMMSLLDMGVGADNMLINGTPDASFQVFAEAASTWEDNPEESYVAVADGKATTRDPVRYMILAALTADSVGDTDAAMIYAVMALYEAHNNPDNMELYNKLRPIAGKYLYEMPEHELPEETELFRHIAGLMYDEADIKLIEDSAFARFLAGRVRYLNNRFVLAGTAVNARTDITDFEAEIRFLRGEILAAQDKMSEAITVWRSVVTDTKAPEWVKAQAQTYLTENKQS